MVSLAPERAARLQGGLTVRPPFAYMTGRGGMAEEARKQIREIEQTQDALRESIEQAKQLADKAQELLQKHKKTVDRSPSD
jgi:hypothetical protein